MGAGAILAGGIQLAGEGIKMVGAAKEAQRQRGIGAENKRRFDEEAGFVRDRFREEERRFRIEGQQAVGASRANIGASGITLEGSSQDVLESSAANIELDALTIRHNGFMKARNLEYQGRQAEFAGEGATEALPFQAASGVLSVGSSVAGFG